MAVSNMDTIRFFIISILLFFIFHRVLGECSIVIILVHRNRLLCEKQESFSIYLFFGNRTDRQGSGDGIIFFARDGSEHQTSDYDCNQNNQRNQSNLLFLRLFHPSAILSLQSGDIMVILFLPAASKSS